MKRRLFAIFVILLVVFGQAAACDPDSDVDVIIVGEIDTAQDVEEYNGND